LEKQKRAGKGGRGHGRRGSPGIQWAFAGEPLRKRVSSNIHWALERPEEADTKFCLDLFERRNMLFTGCGFK